MGFLTRRAKESGFPTAIVTCVLAAGVLSAQPQSLPPASEYEAKAAFLYNCTKFVQWPNKTAGHYDTGLSVCILGSDPFGPTLDAAVRGKKVNGWPLVITRAARLQELSVCHILFISASERNQVGAILAALTNVRGVLTISETEGFAEKGGMINLMAEVDKVRFEINVDAVTRGGLKISSNLLKLARIVPDRVSEGKN